MAFDWTISDAIFALPVPSNSTPNVHSLSLWKIFDRSSCIMPLGMEVGLGPAGDFVLDVDPAHLPKKGAETPNYRPMFIVP